MSRELTLYLINTVANIGTFLVLIFLILTISTILFLIFTFMEVSSGGIEWEDTIIYKLRNYLLVIIPITGIISCFIPSEKTMYIMMEDNIIKSLEIPLKV